MIVKHNNGYKENFSLDRLARSIDKSFIIAKTPHESYLSQIIAKASLDLLKKHYAEEIPACAITVHTYNIMNDLGYLNEAKVYQTLPYLKYEEEA